MKRVTLEQIEEEQIEEEQIEENYELKEENLKIFFHYDPSTYHLHMHFINTKNTKSGSSVEYSHDLDMVIFNLKLDSDYYKKINLNKRV
jgi:m7GpppX diphosphatase